MLCKIWAAVTKLYTWTYIYNKGLSGTNVLANQRTKLLSEAVWQNVIFWLEGLAKENCQRKSQFIFRYEFQYLDTIDNHEAFLCEHELVYLPTRQILASGECLM